MNFLKRVFTLLVLAVVATSAGAAADEGKRLLPASFTQGVTVEFKQDGRVLDVTVKTPAGKWVATRLIVKVSFAPVPPLPPATQRRPLPTASGVAGWKSNDYFLSDVAIETHTIDCELVPGRSFTTHVELKHDAIVDSVTLVESRGREHSFVDRVKSTLR